MYLENTPRRGKWPLRGLGGISAWRGVSRICTPRPLSAKSCRGVLSGSTPRSKRKENGLGVRSFASVQDDRSILSVGRAEKQDSRRTSQVHRLSQRMLPEHPVTQGPEGDICLVHHIKIYLRTNRTKSTHIATDIFLMFLVQALITTYAMIPRRIPCAIL